MNTEKNPRLKVGDKIPKYLDGKLKFYRFQELVEGMFSWVNYKVIRIDTDKYRVQNDHDGFVWGLDISEVDALIEEHERNIYANDNPFYDKEDLIKMEIEQKQDNKKWEPKNGDLVYAMNNINDIGFEAIYIGKNPNGINYPHVVMDSKSKKIYVQSEIKKRETIVSKTQSEVLELAAHALGISKEQLKIVED